MYSPDVFRGRWECQVTDGGRHIECGAMNLCPAVQNPGWQYYGCIGSNYVLRYVLGFTVSPLLTTRAQPP